MAASRVSYRSFYKKFFYSKIVLFYNLFHDVFLYPVGSTNDKKYLGNSIIENESWQRQRDTSHIGNCFPIFSIFRNCLHHIPSSALVRANKYSKQGYISHGLLPYLKTVSNKAAFDEFCR